MSFGAIYAVFALLLFEEVRMILLLLPPMWEAALVLEVAAVCEGGYEGVRLPIGAHLMTVREFVGLAAVVLPVMRVKAHFAVMVVFSVRTPNCFKMVQVKIGINFVFFDHFHGKLRLIVSERAKFLVLALDWTFQIRSAKLCFVLIWVVEFFYSVVRTLAVIAVLAIIDVGRGAATACNFGTNFWLVGAEISPSIFVDVMVVWTALHIMFVIDVGTNQGLEKI